MASKMELSIETLKMSLAKQNPVETLRLVEKIVQHFDDDGGMTGPEFDLGISKLFDVQQGMLTFLGNSIKCNKIHRESNIKVLELFDRLTSGPYSPKVTEYAPAIVEVMLQFIHSSSVSALEKERATAVMQSLVAQRMCGAVQMDGVLVQLLQVFHNAKATGKFLQHVYELLGLVARNYPETMEDGKDYPIRNMFLKTLESVLLTQHAVSFSSITGAFTGLNHFLVNYAPSPTDEPAVCHRIYVCVKKLSDPPADFRQLQVYKASLDLLSTHASIIGRDVFADHRYWHDVLQRWLQNTTNRDYRKTIFQAINAVHAVIASTCDAQQDDSEVAAQETETLRFYVGHFKKTLLAAASTPADIRIAIRGLGLMAGACHRRLPSANLADLLTLVMQRTESLSPIAGDTSSVLSRATLEHYPDFVRALSQIMQHVRQLTNVQLNTLQTILVSLMRDFCYLPAMYTRLTVTALLQTFANLVHIGDAVLDRLMSQCTMRALVWTCSHKLTLDSHNDWERQQDWKDHITVDTFQPMWLGLTCDDHTTEAGVVVEDAAEIRVIKRHMYRHLMDVFFVIVDRLELSVRPRRNTAEPIDDDEPSYVADPNRDLEPVRPADFHLFFNFVQLFEQLLPAQSLSAQRDIFRGYAARFCAVLVRKCSQHPLVSGFVRLMTAGLRVCRRLGFFDSSHHLGSTVALVQRFAKAQMAQVARTQGEMQIACLHCLFALPAQFLECCSTAELVTLYRSAFAVGHGELHVARASLRSLAFFVERGAANVEDVLRGVLPCLDGYLQSSDGIVGEVGEPNAAGKRRPQARAKRLLRVNVREDSDTELVQFQKRVLMFLGSLQPHQCLHLIDDSATDVRDDEHTRHDHRPITRPQIDHIIQLTLHFGDLEPRVHLDALVPRLCALATDASDRSTKIAACELLHSMALYLIGTRQFESAMWRTLCAQMLILGSDGDVAVRQMFEPLLEQIMHYMSHPSHLTVASLRLLLASLMDGVADRRAAGVRDLSARCLRIFVEWTMRQNSSSSALVVTEIVTALRLHSFDSAAPRRRGAALAFNSIYRIVREQDQLVDVVWLDVLYTFAMNYQLSEQFGEPQDLQQVEAALEHVLRVLRERSDLFATSNAGRTVPVGFERATLADAVGWLLTQCGATQTRYRRKCIAIVQQLAPLVDGCASVKAYLQQTQTAQTLLAVVGGLGEDVQDQVDVRRLLAALDFYIWIVGDALADGVADLLVQSKVIRHMAFFLNSIQNAVTSDPLDECQSQCVERALEFITKLLPVHAQVYADELFWSESTSSLTKILSRLIFSPHDVPFVVAPRCCDEFLANYPRICPADTATVIRTHFDHELSTRYDELLHTTEMYLHSTIIPIEMLNSARGISTVLASGNHKLPHDPEQLIRQLFDGLCDQRVDDACAHQLLPDVRAFAQTVMRITFHGQQPFDQLIGYIFDATPLVQPELRSVILHGQHFVNIFAKPIFEYALRQPQATFAAIRRQLSAANAMFVTDLLRDIVQFVGQSPARRHDRAAMREIAVNISLIFTHMMTIHAAHAEANDAEWTAMSFVVLELITHAALIWPDTLISLGQQFVELQTLLVDLIASRRATLELKARAIFLLPCLMDTLTETHDAVEPALATLQENHFPLMSTEYPNGSLERAGYMNVMQAVLDAMVASRSPALLRFVVRCTAADDRHIMETALRTALTTFSGAIGFGGAAHALSVLRIPFEMFGDQRMEPAVRLNVAKRFMLPMLRTCGVEALVKFYGEFLSTLLDWADTNYGLAASGWAVEQALVNRIGAFRLIEVLVGGVAKERLQTDPELLKSITVPTKSLVVLLTTKIMATRSDIFVSNDAAASELFRHYNCATFTAICTLVANTQTELRFFEKLVFHENTKKNEYIWRKLVDCRDSALYTHRLGAEFTELPKQKQRLVSIQAVGGTAALPAGISSRLQSQSQNVFESSFSQDVTRIDLSHSTVRTAEQLRLESAGHRTVELERDAINDHEVMACLCAVVRTMFEKGMTPLPSVAADGEKARLAPQWVKSLGAVLEDGAQPRNARYFIAKLVDNCREHFGHYAATMTGSLLAFLADECALATDINESTSDAAPGSVNYFIIDLIVTLLEWSDRYKLHTVAEIHAASVVLKFLMANAWHARRDVFRQRLEVIRSLLAVWSPAVQLPQQLLVDSLNRTQRTDSRDNLCGLQLNAVVLCACDQLPWTERVCAEYVRCVMISLDNDHASVYQPAAYLLGMVLNRLIRPEDDTDDNAQLQTVRTKLRQMHSTRSDEKRFTDILFAVHRHYPRIVASFLVPIANLIPKTSGTVKRNYLDMFLAAMDAYGADVFRELLTLGLLTLLRSVEFELQALHCVNKALPHMSDAQTQSIWEDLCSCARSRNADARAVAFEIFVYVLVNAQSAELQSQALAQVLRGFSDADARIRGRVFEFWSNCDQLPQQIEKRILGVLDILYNPGVEEQFIGYGTQLLLQVAIQSARAKQQIFPHQSVEVAGNGGVAALAEYEIDVSWSGRNSSMRAPMFLQSQQQRTQSHTQTGMLLATAADSQLAYEPTQDPAALHGSQPSQFASATSGTQSSMLFTVPRQLLDRRSHRVESAPAVSTSGYAKLRERFLSDKDATARKWVHHSRTKQAVRATAAPAAAHRRVQLYRRYRTGDFPDLLINNLAFLLPLQALVQHDRPLASQLFVALYTTITASLDAGTSRPFLLSSSDSVQLIFKRTKRCDPLVFSTLMQLAMQHPQHFELPVDLVAQLAITNRNIALAIGYLERRLHYGWNTEAAGSSAKSNASTIDVEQQHWLKVTELYRALAEPDVVAGIFTEKLDVDGRIPRALALEAVGDFESAQRMYLEAIQRGKKLEKDFAYQSYYELYACMGDWSALARTCDTQLDNPEELWSDDWLMDNVLPYMMRARCRQVLRGDEASREFVQQLEQWVRDPEKADHLNVQFGEELMMMHMAAGEVRHARVYGDRRLTAFLAEWPTVNVLTRKVRAEKMLGIRTVAEMLRCADQLLAKDATGLVGLAERWESDRPHGCDSARLWDTLVAYRGCVAGAVPTPDQACRTRLEDAVAATQFRVLSLSLAQGNVALANRIVQVVPRQQHELRWQVTRAEHQSLKAGRLGRTLEAQCKLQLKAWDGVVRVLNDVDVESGDLEVRLKALELYAAIAERLAKLEISEAVWIRQIASRLGDEHMPADRLQQELQRLVFYNLNKRVQCIEALPAEDDQLSTATKQWFDGQDRGTVHYQLATFCRDQHSSAQHRITVPDCERLIIESLFKAMQFGCVPARQMFPRILDLPALHTSAALQRTFDEASDRVPEWMFLGWIPQMMSYFTFDVSCFLDVLLLRLARAYPVAVYHPFHLSYQRRLDAVQLAEGSDDKTALRCSETVSELLSVLHDPAMDAFVQALLCLGVPEKRLHQHLCELLIELDTCDHEDDNADDRRRLQWRVRRLLKVMWPAHQQRGRSYERLEVYRGELGALLDVESLDDVRDSVHALIKRLDDDNKRQKVHRNDTLRTLSPWLTAFQWCGAQSHTTSAAVGQLELPGQYCGTRQPNAATHVRIIKFDERIRIFETLRQPIRLRVCGTDGRTYSYLLKYGEDLRQDQRVQQLLRLMGDQLRADVQCRAHALRLETFAVVPLSVNCGLLGWVDDSPAMQSVIEQCLHRRQRGATDDRPGVEQLLRSLRTEHDQFIAAEHGGDRPTAAAERRKDVLYGRAAARYSREQLQNGLRTLEYKLPTELLRSALWDMAASAEAFYALRSNFASSLAALSVAHWLLGVGDRHLSNVLLNERTARVVGIDFGLTFGAGTRDQNVPELLPFRMTPQFVQAMNPLGVCGAVTMGMTHALRCLRGSHRLLESCMEVFVREPTIDWLQSARTRELAAGGEEADNSTDISWDPAQRLAIARRKLRGANPRAVCDEELRSGKIARYPEYLAGYQRLVKGHVQHNVRSQLPDDGLTADDQVRCLLDMATDAALLSIGYTGMQMWI